MNVKIVESIDQNIVDYVVKAIDNYEKEKTLYWSDSINWSKPQPTLEFAFDKELGSGCNGYVFEYKGYAVKHFRGSSKYCNDGRMLEKLNGSVYFPTVYAYNDKCMIMQKINGENAEDYQYNEDGFCNDKIREKIHVSPMFQHHIEKAFEYADSRGIFLSDLRPANIMINQAGLPVIVDAGTFSSMKEDQFDFEGKDDCIRWVKQFVNKHCKLESVV